MNSKRIADLTDKECEEYVDAFISNFLGYALKVTEHKKIFLATIDGKTSNINYMKLARFLNTAMNNLLALDMNMADSVLVKLQNDVTSLQNYYMKLSNLLKVDKLVFTRDFLNQVDLSTNPENKKDQLEERLYPFFISKYTETREYIFNILGSSINTKLNCLDKLLWSRASKSMIIQQFFSKSLIKGDYSIKTFIQYYLKTIDQSKTKDDEWKNYLLEILEEVR